MRLFLFLLILNVCCAAQATAPPAGSPPSQSIPVAQENATKARALIDQAIQALGGQAWLNIQDTTQQGRTYSFHRNEATSAGVLFWRFVKFPDKERVEMTKQRDVASVYNGDRGYETTFKGTAALDPKLLDDFLRRRAHSVDWVLRRWINEPGVALFYDGPAVAADKPADQVSILNTKNDGVTLYFDTITHPTSKRTFILRDPIDTLRTT